MDLNHLRASDGTGEAVVANVTADRAVSATTLQVDSLDNWNDEFVVVTGDLDANGYIDPSSMTIMRAHEDSGNIEIDAFVGGYADVGNSEDQIAVIKPTTVWVDELITLLQVSHNDDGTLKDDIVTDNARPRLKHASVTRTATQSMDNSNWDPIEFTAEELDPENWHDNSTNPDRVTVDEAGLYEIVVYAQFTSNTSGVRLLRVIKNGADYSPTGNALYESRNAGTNFNTGITIVMKAVLAANDYVGAEIFQNSGAALDLVEAYMQVTKLSD